MMQRGVLAGGTIILLSFMLIFSKPIAAQTQDENLQSIRAAVMQAIGAEDHSVEVSVAGKVLIVARINSTMNEAGHGARDGEASRIAPVVSTVFADKPEFKSIHTIRVQYLSRSKPNGSDKIIDTVDFRKDPSGVFSLHTT